MNLSKVAIIGAGPAGIACAIQLSRYGIKPVLFERDMPGGLLKNANLVENYPGFPGGISGISLVNKMAKQLKIAGVACINEKVASVDYGADIFQIQTNANSYTARTLVIASGTSPVEHPITRNPYHATRIPYPVTRARLFVHDRISYEVYPIRKVRDSLIAIIGAGDAAFDYALQLATYNKVYIFNRSDRVKCLPVLWEKAKNNPRISYLDNHLLQMIKVDPLSSCLKLFFETTKEMESLLADYIIFAIGRKPELGFADPGFINLFERLQQEKKLYFAGDVKNDLLRQASIAAGDGIRTAMEIYFNESHKENS